MCYNIEFLCNIIFYHKEISSYFMCLWTYNIIFSFPLKQFFVQLYVCGVLVYLYNLGLYYYTFYTHETLIWKKSRETCLNPKSNKRSLKIVTKFVIIILQKSFGRRFRAHLFFSQILLTKIYLPASHLRPA